MACWLGGIADDLTGATDLALILRREGLRVVLVIGPPWPDGTAPPAEAAADADAVIVALKSRTAPKADAVAWSITACDWLQEAGAQRVFFKYCSTFDSTDDGNIGPVAEALLDRLGTDFALACPAFPENGRTVYRGHLFVGDRLLHETSMAHHPLTPMRDADLVRVLSRQCRGRVGAIPFAVVEDGPAAVAAAVAACRAEGCRLAIVDALTDRHLRTIGAAAIDHPLITGGSAIAMGLPDADRARGKLAPRPAGPTEAGFAAPAGSAAVLAGSCSAATLGQIEAASETITSYRLDPLALAERAASDPAAPATAALDWAARHLPDAPVLIYASAEPDDVARAQAVLGRAVAGALVEHTLAAIAVGLVDRGVRRLIVAGGETSGAVVDALGIATLDVGPEIDPGVPWMLSHAVGRAPSLALALKSGNFGTRDFFTKGLGMLA